VITA
jgi:hypothetical protein